MKSSLRLCAGLLCLLVPAFAVDWKALKPQGYVSDFAGVVDPESRAAIDSYAAAVKQATGAELAFVTVKSVEGEPIEDVANDLFHNWGIGRKGEDDGALLSVLNSLKAIAVGEERTVDPSSGAQLHRTTMTLQYSDAGSSGVQL